MAELPHPLTIEELVAFFNLKPLWTKDYIGEFYYSKDILPQSVLPSKYDGERPLYNCAYYLVPEGNMCPLHEMWADETWQYCLGGPLELIWIDPNGNEKMTVIGPDIRNGQKPLEIVPRGHWFGATPKKGSKYSLITHVVAPAFFHQDERKVHLDELLERFPNASKLIQEYAWPKELDFRKDET